MNETFIIGLVQNIALLLSFSMLHDYFLAYFLKKNRITYNIVAGTLLGGIGMMLIITPWSLEPGIFFDTRSIILSVSGLFFGPVPTAIAMAITSVFRFYIGGDGVWMGIAVILSSGFTGIAWRSFFSKWNQHHTGFHLILMGLTVHLLMLSCTLFLPAGSRLNVLDQIFIPVLFIYPVATYLLGQLLVFQRKNINNRNELATSEKRWKYALEGAGDGVWDWNTKTGECFYSKNYKAMLGYSTDDVVNNIDEWSRRLHFEDKDRVLQIMDDYLMGKINEYQAEFRMRNKSGNYLWILARGKIVDRNENGEPIRVIGTHSDISQRRLNEEQKRATESKYHRLLENMMDGFVFVTLNGQITDCNESYCKMLQYSLVELKTKTYQQLTPAKWHKAEQEIVENNILPKGYSGVYEKEYIRKDGTVFPVELSSFLARNIYGEIEGVWGIVRNISKRRETENALHETNEYLESLFNYANAPILVWDNNMCITRFNKALEKLTNYKANEVIGRKIDAFFYTQAHSQSIDYFTSVFSENRLSALEFEIVCKGGQRKLLLWNMAKVFDLSKENVIATIAQGHDITDRKKAEEDVKRLNVQLEAKVMKKTQMLEIRSAELANNEKALINLIEDLNFKTEELEQKSIDLKATNSELEAFSYSVSHDLRAPLRAINNFASILDEEYASNLDDEAKRICAVIDENTKRMGSLIDDLLAFSRLGRSDINIMPVDMNAMVNGVVIECVPENSNIQLHIGPLHSASADSNMMKQVWINLISNAVKFSSKTENPQISITSIEHSNTIAYSVQDNGAGFDMQFADKLFGVFQRLHSLREFDGTGVGLAIAKRVVERHGGTISASAEVGKGAEFVFILPLKHN